MKKMKLSMLAFLLALAGNVSAAKFTVDDFEIAANETKTISINLTNTEEIYGYVLWLQLPEGVTYTRVRDNQDRLGGFSRAASFDDGYLKITGATGDSPIEGTSGEVLTVTITASDQIATGPQTMTIAHQQITVNNAQGAPVTIDQESSTYTCTTKVNVTTAASGYATFSWPRALDFTDSGLEAYVATRDQSGWLHMEQVMQVPAHTGIVVKGATSTTYNPTVIGEASLSQTNLLSPTDEGAVPVTEDGYYVLATKASKGTAFYVVDASKGISIPKYKAYLFHSGSQGADGAVFFDLVSTGIQEVAADEPGEWFNLQGVRVNTPSQRGVYIRDGRKVVVK